MMDDFVKNDAANGLHESDMPYFNQLRTGFQQGPAAVRALLDQIRQENLQKLGIAS
ncbi:MAG: hypothetical protein FWD51_06885 [Betaproteobacteria bacterium]|nr:hypothetical protein [Betaproteobacteria bacterium]